MILGLWKLLWEAVSANAANVNGFFLTNDGFVKQELWDRQFNRQLLWLEERPSSGRPRPQEKVCDKGMVDVEDGWYRDLIWREQGLFQVSGPHWNSCTFMFFSCEYGIADFHFGTYGCYHYKPSILGGFSTPIFGLTPISKEFASIEDLSMQLEGCRSSNSIEVTQGFYHWITVCEEYISLPFPFPPQKISTLSR